MCQKTSTSSSKLKHKLKPTFFYTIQVRHQQHFTGMLDFKSNFPFFIKQKYAKNPMKNNKR